MFKKANLPIYLIFICKYVCMCMLVYAHMCIRVYMHMPCKRLERTSDVFFHHSPWYSREIASLTEPAVGLSVLHSPECCGYRHKGSHTCLLEV